jgi:hypothetical protein
MADSIRVTLMPDRVTVQPDSESVPLMIIIQNTSAIVDQYAVEIEQLPVTWYTLANTAVALFPQDREEATLLLHPPKGTATAGTYPFTVTVLSRSDPSQTTRAEGMLQIGAVVAFDMAMSPTRVAGRKGRYTLTLRNGGNAATEVALEASDPEEHCRYSFSPRLVPLDPGAKRDVKLTLKARRSSLVGPRKTFDFRVRGSPSMGEAMTAAGQLIHTPRFRTWRPIRRLVLLTAVIVVLLSGWLALGGTSGAPGLTAGWEGVAKPLLCGHLNVWCHAAPWPKAPATLPALPPGVPTQCGRPPGGRAVFVRAFKDFHDRAHSVVGDPVINESTCNGVATQITTEGMLIYNHTNGEAFLVRNDRIVWEYAQGKLVQVR